FTLLRGINTHGEWIRGQLHRFCQSFLEQIQVLNLETREMVIERVLALDTAEFDLEDLKWVILMVLFNIPGCENAYQQMEELLFEVNEGMLH
ncbi:DUF494 family protein, partial [Escherichia sp. SS-MK2]